MYAAAWYVTIFKCDENKSQLVHMDVDPQLLLSNERWCYNKYFSTTDTKHFWINDYWVMVWMCISFCWIIIMYEAHRSVSFDIYSCRQTSISEEKIQCVHSNDASSDHMQICPSNITSMNSKSLNKPMTIPLQSIQMTAFIENNIWTYSTLIELRVTQPRPCLFKQIQIQYLLSRCYRVVRLISMPKPLEFVRENGSVSGWAVGPRLSSPMVV